ncbi:MAG: FG-GAP repeat domain-containing protein, partial [Anaerolineae bacterium]
MKQTLINGAIAGYLCVSITGGFCQEWLWVQDDRVLNPSGLDIRSNSTQFQVLDWNGDGLWDFMINETGEIVYYEQVPGQEPFWTVKAIELPKIGFNLEYSGLLPGNFQFFDWDEDGDFDLAADSSRFWWNQGSNFTPVWIIDDALLSGIKFDDSDLGCNFCFSDYDGDGDWDVLASRPEYFEIRLFLNAGDNNQPTWLKDDILIPFGRSIPFGHSAKFVNWDSDSTLDLAVLDILAGTQVFPTGFGAAGFVNRGIALAPDWQDLRSVRLFWTSLKTPVAPAYGLVNYNQDFLTDVVKTDWQRHIAIHFNKGTIDSALIDWEGDLLLGAVNVESRARPFFYYAHGDDLPDLLVTGDSLIDFFVNVFYDGRMHTYQNLDGQFDPGVELTENVPSTAYTLYPNFQKSLTLTIADVDVDGDHDYLMGFIQTDQAGNAVSKGVLYYQNIGTAAQPNWQPDSTRFTYFLAPDSNFYDPRLVDIDHDDDFDLFIQRQGKYTFYERLNSAEESWRQNEAWLSGLDSREHYSAVFADLTRDGKQDLVFGGFDGTLSFFENVGAASAPAWKHIPEAFAGLDVDSLAAPAFADIDGDSRLDMVVGNAHGWLFYFRNESTVDVSSEADSRPGQFQLFQNYPNPFNPATTIEYELAKPGHVQLTIYNL